MNTEGLKHDAGKLRLDLIPPEAIRVLGEVLTCGTDKYGDIFVAKAGKKKCLIKSRS